MNKFRIALGAMALVMAVVAVTSCNKERDLKYSCNPKINRWVLKNVESIAAASRQQLAVLPLDFQKASYLTLSPERKYELWNEKLELVKANWDEPVQNMIVDLQNHITIDWFNDTLQMADFEYLKGWEYQMLSQLMDTVDYAISFMQLASEGELEQMLENPKQFDYSWLNDPSLVNDYSNSKAAPGGNNNLNCKCQWDITCTSLNMGLCLKDHTCNTTPSGCGLLYMYECKGHCENEIVVVEVD